MIQIEHNGIEAKLVHLKDVQQSIFPHRTCKFCVFKGKPCNELTGLNKDACVQEAKRAAFWVPIIYQSEAITTC